MLRSNWSVQDAKNRFSEVVEAAQRGPQMVTKHGKPAVVVLAASEYERLRVGMLLAMPIDGEAFEPLGACGTRVSNAPVQHRGLDRL